MNPSTETLVPKTRRNLDRSDEVRSIDLYGLRPPYNFEIPRPGEYVTIRILPMKKNNRSFLIKRHGDVCMKLAEACYYNLNGLRVPAKGPLFLYALYLCTPIVETSNPYPQGIDVVYKRLSNEEIEDTDFNDPVNSISCRYGNAEPILGIETLVSQLEEI